MKWLLELAHRGVTVTVSIATDDPETIRVVQEAAAANGLTLLPYPFVVQERPSAIRAEVVAAYELARYDFDHHCWTRGPCPYGDICTGCDADGRCSRMEDMTLGRVSRERLDVREKS